MRGAALAPRERLESGSSAPRRRRIMRHEIAWILAAKFLALGFLWILFFSSSHRPHIDAEVTSQQLAIDVPADPRGAGPHVSTQEGEGR
jgi:hypothetical protein